MGENNLIVSYFFSLLPWHCVSLFCIKSISKKIKLKIFLSRFIWMSAIQLYCSIDILTFTFPMTLTSLFIYISWLSFQEKFIKRLLEIHMGKSNSAVFWPSPFWTHWLHLFLCVWFTVKWLFTLVILKYMYAFSTFGLSDSLCGYKLCRCMIYKKQIKKPQTFCFDNLCLC